MTLIFDKLSPPTPKYVSKDALNHFLVNSNAKNSLRRVKNVVFFLFCILVDWSMGGGGAKPPSPGYATVRFYWEKVKNVYRFEFLRTDVCKF